MKKTLIIFSILFFFVTSFFAVQGYLSIGTAPSGDHLEQISKSKNYSISEKRFVNRRQPEMDKARDNMNLSGMGSKFFFGGGKDRKPKIKLPEVQPLFKDFVGIHKDVKFIWFGHSTILVNMNGKLILFDPVFSKYASPVMFLNKRFQDVVVNLSDLPVIDYIVISHDHYDHLDLETIKFFKDTKTKFLTPLGVSAYLQGWGIEKQRTTELDWWESIELNGLTFTCTPAQHFSNRGLTTNLTLWASWAVKSSTKNIYFSGDSGYDTHFKDIGDKLGPFDVTFIENGQYNEMWKDVHILPNQTPRAFKELRGKTLVPIHWGAYDLSLHNWYDPIVAIKDQAYKHNIKLIAPIMGQSITVGADNGLKEWWLPLIK